MNRNKFVSTVVVVGVVVFGIIGYILLPTGGDDINSPPNQASTEPEQSQGLRPVGGGPLESPSPEEVKKIQESISVKADETSLNSSKRVVTLLGSATGGSTVYMSISSNGEEIQWGKAPVVNGRWKYKIPIYLSNGTYTITYWGPQEIGVGTDTLTVYSSEPNIVAEIDIDSLTSWDDSVTLTGSVSGVSNVSVEIRDESNKVVAHNKNVEVVNGRWSSKIFTSLPDGLYNVGILGPQDTRLVFGSLWVENTGGTMSATISSVSWDFNNTIIINGFASGLATITVSLTNSDDDVVYSGTDDVYHGSFSVLRALPPDGTYTLKIHAPDNTVLETKSVVINVSERDTRVPDDALFEVF